MRSLCRMLRDHQNRSAEPIHKPESRCDLHSEASRAQVVGKGVAAQLAPEFPLPSGE